MVNYSSLIDMVYHGPLYTWCNKRKNGLILKKLDIMLVNDKWRQDFPQSYNVFETRGCSDHFRSRIHINHVVARPRKSFKFVNVIAELDEFKPMVEGYWKEIFFCPLHLCFVFPRSLSY